MTTRQIIGQAVPFAPVALLVPVVLLPIGVLVPLAFLGLVVAGLVAVTAWAAHDSLAVRPLETADAPPDHEGRTGRQVPDYRGAISSRRR